jgi:hypothetical protein
VCKKNSGLAGKIIFHLPGQSSYHSAEKWFLCGTLFEFVNMRRYYLTEWYQFVILFSCMLFTLLVLFLIKSLRYIRRIYLEMRCPRCGRNLAAIVVDEDFKGFYNKYEMDPFKRNLFIRRVGLLSTRKMKFQIRNRCRHCGYEWFTTRSEKA